MNPRVCWTWCVLLSIAALCWLVLGVPGVLLFATGVLVGQLDVGWLPEDLSGRWPFLDRPLTLPVASPDTTLPPIPARRFGV